MNRLFAEKTLEMVVSTVKLEISTYFQMYTCPTIPWCTESRNAKPCKRIWRERFFDL